MGSESCRQEGHVEYDRGVVLVMEYEKPSLQYWTASELDEIEATMSGGGGYAPTMSSCLANYYAFGPEGNSSRAIMIEALWDRIVQVYAGKGVSYCSWLFFRALADFVYSSLDIKGVPFSLVAGPYVGTDVLFLNELSMSENFLRSIQESVEYASDETNDAVKIDFCHMCVVVATHLAIELGLCPADALSSIGANSGQSVRDLAGWLGDASIPSPSISFSSPDSNADMDAVNIARLLYLGQSAKSAIRKYYRGCVDAERARSFKANMSLSMSVPMSMGDFLNKIIVHQNMFGAAPDYVLGLSAGDRLSFIRSHYPDVYMNFLAKL